MELDLRKKSISAVAWSAVEACSRQGVQFVISIVLARLLAPEIFGLIAMLSLFIGLASCFCEAGFSSALIQKADLSPADTSSVFYFNLAMGLVMALLFWAAAPWIAAFYHAPVLSPLTRVMGLNLFLGTLGAVQQTLLAKALDFRSLMRVSVVASVVSGMIGIALAWQGYGVWSLAMQALLSTIVATVLLWWLCPWRPAWLFSLKALRSLFRFGSYLFLSGVIDLAYTRAYTLVIGKFYSPGALGLYSRADSTQQIPTNLLSTVVTRVSFPIFAAVAHDRTLLRRALRKVLTSIMLLNIPAMLGLMVVARPFVLSVFGSKWLACVPYLQILCIAGCLWPLHVLNLSVLKAMGRSDLFFRLEIIKKAVGVGIVVVSCFISISAMAWGVALISVLSVGINGYYTGVLLDYAVSKQLRDILPSVCISAVMTVCIWPLSLIPAIPAPLLLGLQISTGLLAYGAICFVLRVESFEYALKELRVSLPRSKISPPGLRA